MSHPSRTGREWFPSWPRVVDDGRGLTRNFCATLRAAAEAGGEWSVLAQDDVEPCVGLEDGLGRLLAEAPAPVVAGFSLARVIDSRLIEKGIRWRPRKRGELLWVMLLAVRTDLIADLAAGVERQARPADARGGRHALAGCDERLSLWLDGAGIQAVTHVPNIVQHRGESSTVGHGWTIGGRPRVSPTYRDGARLAELCGWR